MSTDAGRRRLYGPALVAGLLGGTAITVGATRPWITASAAPTGLPTIQVSVSGTELAPLCAALGLVVLGAFGAVVATRGRLRQALGVVVLGCCLVVAVLAIATPIHATDQIHAALSARGWTGGGYDTGGSGWRWLVVAGSLAAGAAGALTARYGAGWAVMGSRYDAPGSEPATSPITGTTAGTPPDELSELEVWQAIDRGQDPTRD